MSQHDYLISNQDGASFRGDLNSVLAAIATLNSGATEPAAMFGGMLWLDTTTGILKQRNSGNTAWVALSDALLAGKTINGALGVSGNLTVGGTAAFTNQLTLGTSQASTSGTSRDFTGIPNWVKRISVMFSGVSTSGSSALMVQLGSGSFTTTGYTGNNGAVASGVATALLTTGMGIDGGASISGSTVRHGKIVISNFGGNTWSSHSIVAMPGSSAIVFGASIVSLSGALDRLRLTTVNGTDTFDAGSVNILYE